MRSARSEHILLAALLLVPLVMAFLGWPAFMRWAAGPSPEATPAAAGAAATSTAVVGAPTSRPTQGVPPTVNSRPTAVPTVRVTATPVPVAATQATAGADDPSAAVQDFYARVAAHDFDDAAALWSPRMRAAFPPAQNIDQRFSGTRSVTVRRADVVSQTGDRAAVAVQLDEAAADGQHHWSGTWQVVRGPDGWLLDQPQLQGG
ncbi:MAG: hypothetical protein JOZ81_31230 [Chloroflexi bacterium]|nr:hypothetical protein [Chloroflexota bacterium]MBV9546740.1 hypothetical protein [Chloroflexota bacterium]